jgi:hypothetical protein
MRFDEIVEHPENDDYWGDCGDGRGKNMLGRILSEVREYMCTGPAQQGLTADGAARRR